MRAHFGMKFFMALACCNAWCNAKKLVPTLKLAVITNYKEWENVYVKKQKKYSESKDEFYTKLGIITKESSCWSSFR